MSKQSLYFPYVRFLWAAVLCAGLAWPPPVQAAVYAPGQLWLPFAGEAACVGRMDPGLPIGVQLYGASNRSSPYMPYLLRSGAAWVRVLISWPSVEAAPGQYNFDPVESAAAAYHHACVNIIATIDFTPAWAALYEGVPGYPNRSPIRTENYGDYANLVAALAERYDGDGIADSPSGVIINYWELYNEPDYGNSFDGGGWGEYGARYAAMLKTVYPALKAANPAAQLVFGGIAHDGFVEDGGAFVRDFLKNVLDEDGGDYFDVMNFHFYPAFRSAWTTGNGSGLPEKTAAIRAILQEYELEKPIVVTEAGWHNNDGGIFPSTDEIQSNYVVQFFTQAIAFDLDFLIWWRLNDSGESSPRRNGLVTDTSPPIAKLSYVAYATAAARLGPARYTDALTAADTQDADLEVYRLRDPNDKTFYVAWLNPIETTAVAPLTLAATTATVYDKSNILVAVIADDADGVADGRVTVMVGGSPIYIVVQ